MKYVTRIIHASGLRVWLDHDHRWTDDVTKAKKFDDREAQNQIRRLHYMAEAVDITKDKG